MKEYVIEVSKLHKKFWYFKKDFKIIHWLFNKTKFDKEFYVLKGIDFEVKKGEKVGILGKNGAGKSTLLKIISEVYYPTYGDVVVNGKVSSLLELGSGFNAQLTGRENIYLKGTLLGMSKKEIDDIVDDVVEFADIGEYMEMPFSSYSSGMRARLGFAMAVNINPDILIIDEVFAVGDKNFQIKSRTKTEEFFKAGKTILFVSHSESLVKEFCDRVIYLKDGHIAFDGDVDKGLELYNKDVAKDSYIPRLFVDDFTVSNDEVLIDVRYGLGIRYEINDPFDFTDVELLAEKFEERLTNYFAAEKIDLIIKNKTKDKLTVSINKQDITKKIDLRIKFFDTNWDHYHYIHCVDGILKKEDSVVIDGIKFTGNFRDVLTIEPN